MTIETIDQERIQEVLSLGLEKAEDLISERDFRRGVVNYWASSMHVALEPVPEHQGRFRIMSCNQSRGSEERLSVGASIVRNAISDITNDDDDWVFCPSPEYWELLSRIPERE